MPPPIDTALPYAAALLIGYLLGSIPFGLILTRCAGKPDIRSIGSGNIGATNVLRTGSKPLAAATLIGDTLKGTAAVLLARLLFGPDAALAAAAGALLGHMFPVWLSFKGGKGVATYIGLLIGLAWPAALVFCLIWLAVAALTRYSSLAGLTAAPPCRRCYGGWTIGRRRCCLCCSPRWCGSGIAAISRACSPAPSPSSSVRGGRPGRERKAGEQRCIPAKPNFQYCNPLANVILWPKLRYIEPMNVANPLTADLEEKTKVFLSIVEEEQSPIKNSLSDVAQLRDAYGELKNIARALDQYARINKGLRYIGLMGTFSSGKSSIINSLVGQDARAADLPPIDDEITILTHPTNRDALMGAHSRGLLKVTTQTIDAELLTNCFLVDTPGSGDPEVREGMVRDFLPICDLILYVFSATSALSIPDLSVLRTLQDKLDFVPLRFVITRSDEFKKDHLLPLTEDNVDRSRLDDFLSHLIGRIRTQAPHLNFSPTNFFFVDNRTKFGIFALKAHIVSELESDVQLHSKKIAYFRRGVSAQKNDFREVHIKINRGCRATGK